MELFHFKRDIPFMSYGKLTTFISLATFILAVFFLATRGLNLSVEFTGGTLMEVEYKQQGANIDQVRQDLENCSWAKSKCRRWAPTSTLWSACPTKLPPPKAPTARKPKPPSSPTK